ncbi:MAG: type II toxin-antitoxin system HigB family toxin [Spirochaetota bacterium]|nr:type II toxin-antitoxin system HigB family toxin [Spirochaetota bacterium]
MRIISKKVLREFWDKYPDTEQPLNDWYRAVEKAEWQTPSDIINQFPNARVIPNNRTIFNIRGNQYRLIAYIDYSFKIVYIRFIGTHSDYDCIDAKEI